MTPYDPSEKFAPTLKAGDVSVVTVPRQCDRCLHRAAAPGYPACDAFLRIPVEILTGARDHRHPFPGDDGVLFAQDPAMPDHFDAPPLTALERLM